MTDLHHPRIFTLHAVPATTLPVYAGLGQAPDMLACIPSDMVLVTHQRSIAERGGCFQWHLFISLSVCLFVSQHSNFQTIKRRMMKLGS